MNNASMSTMHNNPHSMGDDPAKHAEHMAFETLIKAKKPTHIAIRSGKWSDPNTWKNRRVPGNNAKVLIEKGTTVTYDQVSEARIDTIANRGNFQFETNRDTKLVVETILNASEGKLDIGSARRSVAADKRAQIVFTSDRAVNRKIDPTQLSKGLVSHGEVNIYGAKKLDKAALVGDAAAGSNTLTFKQNLAGWKVGDQIVLGGTNYGWNGKDEDNSRFQDEVLTITAIKGKTVSFTNNDITGADNDVLRFNHTRSKLAGNPNELNLYVANLTRNVSFETENGKKVPINHRAHVMLMHNPKVNVLNAGFYELGRSDKSKMVDDIGKNIDGSKGNGTNIRGRYILHLHKTGVDDPNGQASIIRGNALIGGPGWGFVQHESHAGVEDNVVFDVVGSGFVAESGNELGWWTDNLAIKATGIDWRKGAAQRDARKDKFDLGFEGEGFWIQGAGLIRQKDNKAVSTNRAGMVLFGSTLDPDRARPIKTIPIKNLPKNIQKLFAKGQTEADIRDIPFATVQGFESYNSTMGFRVWAHGTNFDGEGNFSSRPVGFETENQEPNTAHTGRSRIENFKVWGNRYSGAEVFYSSNIDLKNGLILGREANVAPGHGLFSNHATVTSTYDNIRVGGYREGALIQFPSNQKNFVANTLKNSRFFKNTYNLGAMGDKPPVEGRPDDFGPALKASGNTFEVPTGNRAPVANFNSKAIGGLSVQLDAGASYDRDPLLPKDGKPRPLASKGIALYAWDLNGDGRADRFGRTLNHSFDKAGNNKVSLSVFDSKGASTTVEKTINVRPTAYSNPFKEGSFGRNTRTQKGWKASSQWSDDGWFISDGARVTGGAAKLSKAGDWGEFIGRTLLDEKVTKGKQTLSFSLKNKEGGPDRNDWEKNEVTVKLWGVNGQFNNDPYTQSGPTQVGTLGMRRTALVDERFGGVGGEFFDWKKFSYDVDLGKGYDFLLFQVNTLRTNNPADYVAIDNVSLTGPANSITGGTETILGLNNTGGTYSGGSGGSGSGGSGSGGTTAPNPIRDDRPAGGQPPVGKQLVAQLSFEDILGKVARDTSTEGKDNSGLLSGRSQPTSGKVGQAIALNGGADVVSLKNSVDINQGIHAERTIALAFKVEDAASSKKQVIYEEGGGGRGLNIYVADNLLHFGGWNRKESKWRGSVIETEGVKSGQWHHVALVLDGETTVTNNALTAYLDGSQVGQAEGSQLWSRGGRIGLGNVSGATRFGDGTMGRNGQHGLIGAVDEFQVYNSALTRAEVKQLSSDFV